MVTNRESIQAAQAILSGFDRTLVSDGWWGSHTHGVYTRSPLNTRTMVDALLRTSGTSADRLLADSRVLRKKEKESGVISQEYKMSVALRGSDGSEMFPKLPANARRLASRAYGQGIKGVSLVNFLANVKVESNFVPRSENHNYSGPQARANITAMAKMSDAEVAALVAKGRAAFFEVAYGSKSSIGTKPGGLGNFNPGDGGLFYGRGLKQVTGRYNYEQLSKAFPSWNLLQNPDVLSTDWEKSADAAIWFWKTSVMRPGKDRNIVTASIAVNGGKNGLQDRISAANTFTPMILA